MLAGAGFREVLVQRHRRFDLWAPPAFWLSITFGAVAAVTTVALAPLAARFYQAPELATLIYVLALTNPLLSIACVPEANLRIHMRFRALSVLTGGRTIGTTLASVALAALGAGAMSFVLPRPFFALLYAIGAWLLAPSLVEFRPRVRRWRFLLADSLKVLLASVVLMVIGQAGFIVLGRLCNEDVVGHYYFAYNLSLQTAVLLGLNFAGVLFPALTSLQNEPARQRDAFVRASRVLAVLGLPMCAMQAALALPIIKIFYGDRMLPATELFAILSIGMGYHVLWNPSRSLLQSGGRFGLSLLTLSAYAIVFVPAVVAGALLRESWGVAVATAAVFIVAAPIETFVAMRATCRTSHGLWTVYGEPTLLTVAAIGPWWLLTSMLPHETWALWLRLATIPLCGGLTYLGLLAWRMPDVLGEVRTRLGSLVARPA
jgi:PST family polysaccharide transporter